MSLPVVIINPESAGGATRDAWPKIASELATHFGPFTPKFTKHPGEGIDLAAATARTGTKLIIACGGDGTIHDVLQGLAGSPQIAMGVLPLGTANALANDLQLPRNPEEAARRLLTYSPKTIAAGKIECQTGDYREERYFTVMAGVGPDAELIYRLTTGMKQRFGVTAYVAQAAWLYLRYHYAPFQAQYRDLKTGELRTETVAQVMAVRIDDFGGPLRRLARGAKLENNCLRLILFKRAIRLTYPAYLINSLIVSGVVSRTFGRKLQRRRA